MNDITTVKKGYSSVNNWLIDAPSGSIVHVFTGEKKRLGEYQLKMLEVLFENRGVILTREALTALVWEGRVIGNNSLPNAIHALRIALEDDGKQQKIIKTIPRKGYLLDVEYCRYLEENTTEYPGDDQESDNSPSEKETVQKVAAAPPNTEIDVSTVEVNPPPAEMQPGSFSTAQTSVSNTADTKIFTWRKVLLVLAMVFICAAFWWYFSKSPSLPLKVIEVESGVYSNIRLHEVWQIRENQRRAENLHNTLRDTFNNLNQQLKISSSHMQVYYSTTNLTLNYTLYITNPCGQRQLSMAIKHWRTEPQQLNTLILRETRRIINEMATCPTP